MSDEAEWISLDEIDYINTESTKKEKSFKVYYTSRGRFRNCTSVDKEYALLEKEEGMVKIDRGILANLNKKPDYDHKYDLLIYESKNQTKRTITVAEKRVQAVKDYLERLFKKKV
ncbi:hypothetical protein [Paenibacillus sophorae]|nr:hypothetical protein [Paenibacillus sophorae]QWU14338.1 hypothetical protein KP014_20745 [Paenibacillus sophorae]